MPILAPIGRITIAFFAVIGRVSIFTGHGISHCVRPPFFPRQILRQAIEIGFYSLPVVGMTAIFTGMVLALQSFAATWIGSTAPITSKRRRARAGRGDERQR